MNKDISKLKKKLNPLRYYLLIYIVIVLLVVFIDLEIIDSKDSEYRIGIIRGLLSLLSVFILPFLAIFNCFIHRYNFWRTLLEFLLCFAVLISMAFGLMGVAPHGLVRIYSFGAFLKLSIFWLRYLWPYSIPVSIISAIIVWLVIKKVAQKKELIDSLE